MPRHAIDSPSHAAAQVSARALASRRNGARSRGPTTAAGKARSARNALQHGLCARTVLLDDEDAAAPAAAPTTRARNDPTGRQAALGAGLIRDGNGPRALETLVRYRGAVLARLLRELFRALGALKALQAEAQAQVSLPRSRRRPPPKNQTNPRKDAKGETCLAARKPIRALQIASSGAGSGRAIALRKAKRTRELSDQQLALKSIRCTTRSKPVPLQMEGDHRKSSLLAGRNKCVEQTSGAKSQTAGDACQGV